MLVYGDRSRTVAPGSLILDLERRLAAARKTGGLMRLDLCTRALIAAGELAQGLADDAFETIGKDGCSPAAEATMALAIAVAGDLLAAAGQPTGLRADVTAALAAVRRLALPACIRCKTPEGYAFYAVYPEDYAAAAAPTAGCAHALVIGLRSIGTSLAAAVAARLGCPALTLRPCGHPFHRELRVAQALRARLARHPGRFIIVDEGPGLSGSSFGAAADLLEDLGVPLGRMLFLTGHANDLGPHASPAHSARWARSRRAAATGSVSPKAVPAWFGDVIGPVTQIEDLSGGDWRRDLPEAAWPPAAPVTERRKFRVTCPTGRFVARFAGLGAAGDEKLAVARLLHAAGLAPEPLALRRGFLLERWSEGTPLAPPEPRSERFLGHLGRYLGFRARVLTVVGGRGASLAELRRMACANAAELGGPGLARLVQARLAEAEDLAGIVPARIDGRLHAWEWLRLPDGSFLKTDALDHAVGHDLVGCQDIAWDVAGAAVEFGLSDAEVERLRAAVGAAAGREVSRPAVAVFRICYAAFQGALWRTTGESGPAGSARVEVLGLKYLAALRQSVEAEGERAAASEPGAQRQGSPVP
jgi:hypothetical protein